MALIDEVTAYYPTQKLVEWTNPDTVRPTTIDTTNLQTACDDTEAEFAIWAGETYDNTNRQHLVIARDGVELQLRKKASKGGAAFDEKVKAWEAKCKQYALTSARDRIAPDTDGYTEVSNDQGAKRPIFDRRKFNGVRAK